MSFPISSTFANDLRLYVFSTGHLGLGFLAGELVSNSIDQFLANCAKTVQLRIEGRVITVADDGEGLPFDQPSKHGNESLFVDYMTKLHKTPTADNHAPHVHIHSCFGLGLMIVNALSESVTVHSWCGGKLWRQSFSRGRVISDATQIPISELNKALFLTDRGTEITFIPDSEIFGESEIKPLNFRKRMFDSAHLFAGLKVCLQDEVFYAPKGLAALAATQLMSGSEIGDPLNLRVETENFMLDLTAFGRARKHEFTN